MLHIAFRAAPPLPMKKGTAGTPLRLPALRQAQDRHALRPATLRLTPRFTMVVPVRSSLVTNQAPEKVDRLDQALLQADLCPPAGRFSQAVGGRVEGRHIAGPLAQVVD